MKSKELRKYLKGDMLLVLEATGAAATIELMRRLGGLQIYVQKMPIELAVKLFYDGKNKRALAREYNCAEATIDKYLRQRVTPSQEGLFEKGAGDDKDFGSRG